MSDSSSHTTSHTLSHTSASKVDSSHRGHAQQTLKKPIYCRGVGLHLGVDARLTLLPADVGSGILLQRKDIPEAPPFRLSPESVVSSHLSTVIAPPEHPPSYTISTIEHLMAALHAMEIDNVIIQVEGPEFPILDGCASDYAFLIECAGIVKQNKSRRQIDICRPVEVTTPDGAFARLIPTKGSNLKLSVTIDFPAPVIGKQHYQTTLDRSHFLERIAFCRTFVNYGDIAALKAQGMGMGGSLKNVVVVDGDHVLNPDGLHVQDEFVRHKMIDVIGDLYCSGYRLRGRFEGFKTGHTLNNRLLRALFASQDNWCFSLDKRRVPVNNK
ncbi:UDP-3-O-[3-hydroxymyristoyl] N-acetylglucosamine deacetylase [Saccharibacter sp. 17.LH.SD]|uniref:UDP-3-O-acyl-N-acetylglucosamine deacetylase n=1 Tax=Saccharibacter sp. 17.LH.SD TaxID=2689393 RepID=UPI0013700126|nr:UDP-3-O-acyl-N-acetylglucosamine deacetylase [Saccharibacter sp. 17.LH.SD]MXV44678.1 UDP-3-O-[3-hydroxymyristoyl] N-acetylglucosamine deacetylase [Saccharibacter sp. 17.LH.SD]